MTNSFSLLCVLLGLAAQAVAVKPTAPTQLMDGVHRAARGLDAGTKVGVSYSRYLEMTQQLATELLLARDQNLAAPDRAALTHYEDALRLHKSAVDRWRKSLDAGPSQVGRQPDGTMRLAWRAAAIATEMALNVRSGRTPKSGLEITIAEYERDERQVALEIERAAEAQRRLDEVENQRRAAAAVPVQPPQLISKVPPVYPPIAQSARVQGTVTVEVDVDADGRVADVKVLRSIPLLDPAAIMAVRAYKYSPAMRAGVPVKGKVTETVAFALR